MLTSLKNSGFSVTRISGANRYEVAKNVAYRIEALRGNNKVTQAFVVRGDAFYDALMVSALAYNRKVPVLYTPNKSLSTNTARAIRALDIDEVIIGGDTNVVSSRVAHSMARLRSVDRVTRWGGYGAAGTSVAITNGAAKRGWISYSTVGTVNWVSYPDGLSASSAIGYRRGRCCCSPAPPCSRRRATCCARTRARSGRCGCSGARRRLTSRCSERCGWWWTEVAQTRLKQASA